MQFKSPNCMRELLRTVVTHKPLVTMLEPELKRGGMTREQIQQALATANAPCEKSGVHYTTMYEMWGLAEEVGTWGYQMPTEAELAAALFAKEPIEWNRMRVTNGSNAASVDSSTERLCVRTSNGQWHFSGCDATPHRQQLAA